MSKLYPFVSIILPVYNGERTLKASLESLLIQTYSHFELLIGIDGTYDGSKAIIKSFVDDRIKVVEHPVNLGLAENLNKLMTFVDVKSEFIAMAEQDDVYVPERLQWQVDIVQNNPHIGLVSGIAEFISDTKKVKFPGILINGQQFPQGKALFKYLYVNQLKVVNTCMMIRKTVHLGNNLRFNNTYGNFNVDWDYVLRFALVSQVYGIPKVLVQMDRTTERTSVTIDKWAQFNASRQLIRDFEQEFTDILTAQDYKKALKMCRKLELGHLPKFKIVTYALFYAFLYMDIYFLKYLMKRIKSKLNFFAFNQW